MGYRVSGAWCLNFERLSLLGQWHESSDVRDRTTLVSIHAQGRRLWFASERDNYGERSEPKILLIAGRIMPPATAKLNAWIKVGIDPPSPGVGAYVRAAYKSRRRRQAWARMGLSPPKCGLAIYRINSDSRVGGAKCYCPTKSQIMAPS
jgi:hypothetical protein